MRRSAPILAVDRIDRISSHLSRRCRRKPGVENMHEHMRQRLWPRTAWTCASATRPDDGGSISSRTRFSRLGAMHRWRTHRLPPVRRDASPAQRAEVQDQRQPSEAADGCAIFDDRTAMAAITSDKNVKHRSDQATTASTDLFHQPELWPDRRQRRCCSLEGTDLAGKR